MPHLSWNEVRDRAIRFSRNWSDATSERADKQTFYNEFFDVFGIRRASVAAFEANVRNLQGNINAIDLLWRGKLIVEHKSRGEDLSQAETQAFGYIEDLTREGRTDEVPRFVLVSDFANFVLYDLETEEQLNLPLFAGRPISRIEFPLADLPRHIRSFAFMLGQTRVRFEAEDEANEKAYRRMCELHDALKAGGLSGHDLERMLVRILFCLFAEDTLIFQPEAFTQFIRTQTRADGADLGARLNELFDWLNKPAADQPMEDTHPFYGFRYVNGGLFNERLDYPRFNSAMRDALLFCCEFMWAKISPAVFGSLFQGVMDDRARRQQGAHYIRRFLTTRNAERVLFIVDRIELAKQTLEDFNVVLAEYKPVLYKTARRKPGELLGSSVVVATLQSLMVDRRYREEFTPFHFDLVVNDEAHRSIYGDAREVVQFFQATRVGLTATPRAYLKNVNVEELQKENPKALELRLLRDTYNYFGCKPGFPTFRYDIIDAVKDPEGPFLCLPKIVDLRSDITTKALDEGGWAVVINEQEENFKIKDLEKKIFTPARNRVMCEAFLKEAQRDPAGNIGKSLVFAVNQTHATELTKIFNAIQPGIAVTITSRVDDASSIAKEFRDGKRAERIAVSVDTRSRMHFAAATGSVSGAFRILPIKSPSHWLLANECGSFKRKYSSSTGRIVCATVRGVPLEL